MTELTDDDRELLRQVHQLVLAAGKRNGNGGNGGLWRHATLIVTGIAISLGATTASLLLTSSDYVTRDDLRREMQQASPYVMERETLREWRSRLDTDLNQLAVRVDKLWTEITALQLREAERHGKKEPPR